MIKYLVVAIGLIFIFGCASSSKVQTNVDQGGIKSTGKYDESFDPLTLDDDDIEINREENRVPVDQNQGKTETNEPEEKVVMHEVEGYRVQILATQGLESATLQQQRAIDRFAEYDYKIYDRFRVEENNEYLFFVEDMIIFIKDDDPEHIGVSFQVTTKPHVSANHVLILKEIEELKDIFIMECFIHC